MTDLGPITPIRCPDPSCHWSAHGIPDHYTDARARHLAEHQAKEHARRAVTSHAYEGGGGPCTAEAYGQACGVPRTAHQLDEDNSTPTPLLPEREQEIRETDPGDWYRAPWTTAFVEGSGEADDPSYWRVISEGETIATLPDFAGSLARFIADARVAVPELLDELDRVRAERDKYATELDRLHLERWEDQPTHAERGTVAWERIEDSDTR